MNENAKAVMFCCPEDAKDFIQRNPEVEKALVVTTLVQKGQVVIVEEQKFLDWLFEKEEVPAEE